MYSRAHLLIELEQEKLLADIPWGIEAWPLYDDTIFEWMAKIKGLRNTPWEGGIFKVYIQFVEHFNVRPPRITFQTIPFHPNVDMNTGRPCVDFLDDSRMWKEDYSLSMILVSLQTLLSNPVCENAVNTDAANMLLQSPELYHQMVRECVATSQLVEAGQKVEVLPSRSRIDFLNHTTPKLLSAPPRTGSSYARKLSFADYHKTWLDIATSKTSNPLLETANDHHTAHLGLSSGEAEELQRKQLEVSHNMLVYGNFKTRELPKTDKGAKLVKLERMRQIYLPPRQSPALSRQDITNMEVHSDVKEHKELWEEEVDDLVEWSHSLDSNILDTR